MATLGVAGKRLPMRSRLHGLVISICAIGMS